MPSFSFIWYLIKENGERVIAWVKSKENNHSTNVMKNVLNKTVINSCEIDKFEGVDIQI